MKKTYKIALLVVALVGMTGGSAVYAGPGFGTGITDAGGGAGGAGGGGGSAPLDGGITLLVAAGIGYGTKKMRSKKKYSQAELDEIKKYIYK